MGNWGMNVSQGCSQIGTSVMVEADYNSPSWIPKSAIDVRRLPNVVMKMIRANYPSVNPDELEVKIRASLSEVLMWIDPESDRSAALNGP